MKQFSDIYDKLENTFFPPEDWGAELLFLIHTFFPLGLGQSNVKIQYSVGRPSKVAKYRTLSQFWVCFGH